MCGKWNNVTKYNIECNPGNGRTVRPFLYYSANLDYILTRRIIITDYRVITEDIRSDDSLMNFSVNLKAPRREPIFHTDPITPSSFRCGWLHHNSFWASVRWWSHFKIPQASLVESSSDQAEKPSKVPLTQDKEASSIEHHPGSWDSSVYSANCTRGI